MKILIHIVGLILVFLQIFFIISLIDKAESSKPTDPKIETEMLADYERARIYAQLYLRFEHKTGVREWSDGYKVDRQNGKSIVSGEIKNIGSRGLNDIILTIFCVDHTGEPLNRTDKTFPSIDTEPLQRYDRRPFEITVEQQGSSGCELIPFITGIKFAS